MITSVHTVYLVADPFYHNADNGYNLDYIAGLCCPPLKGYRYISTSHKDGILTVKFAVNSPVAGDTAVVRMLHGGSSQGFYIAPVEEGEYRTSSGHTFTLFRAFPSQDDPLGQGVMYSDKGGVKPITDPSVLPLLYLSGRVSERQARQKHFFSP